MIALYFTDLHLDDSNVKEVRHLLRRNVLNSDDYVYNEEVRRAGGGVPVDTRWGGGVRQPDAKGQSKGSSRAVLPPPPLHSTEMSCFV